MTITTDDAKTYTSKKVEKSKRNVAERKQYKLFSEDPDFQFQFDGYGFDADRKDPKVASSVSISDLGEHEYESDILAKIKEDSREYEMISERKQSCLDSGIDSNMLENGIYSRPFIISSNESLFEKPLAYRPTKLEKTKKRRQEISASAISSMRERSTEEVLENSNKVVQKIENILNKREQMKNEKARNNIEKSPLSKHAQIYASSKLKTRTPRITATCIIPKDSGMYRNRSTSLRRANCTKHQSNCKVNKSINMDLSDHLLSNRKISNTGTLKFIDVLNPKTTMQFSTPKTTNKSKMVTPKIKFSSFASTFSGQYSSTIRLAKKGASCLDEHSPHTKIKNTSMTQISSDDKSKTIKESSSARQSKVRSKLDKYLSAGIVGLKTDDLDRSNIAHTKSKAKGSSTKAHSPGYVYPIQIAAKIHGLPESDYLNIDQLPGSDHISKDASINTGDNEKDMSTSLFSVRLAMLKKTAADHVIVSSKNILDQQVKKAKEPITQKGNKSSLVINSRIKEEAAYCKSETYQATRDRLFGNSPNLRSPLMGTSARNTPKPAKISKLLTLDGSQSHKPSESYYDIKKQSSITKKILTATELTRWAKTGMTGQLYTFGKK